METYAPFCRDYEGETRWVFPTEVSCSAPGLTRTPCALVKGGVDLKEVSYMQDNYYIKDLIQRLEGKSGSVHRFVLLLCCH